MSPDDPSAYPRRSGRANYLLIAVNPRINKEAEKTSPQETSDSSLGSSRIGRGCQPEGGRAEENRGGAAGAHARSRSSPRRDGEVLLRREDPSSRCSGRLHLHSGWSASFGICPASNCIREREFSVTKSFVITIIVSVWMLLGVGASVQNDDGFSSSYSYSFF